MSEVHTNIVRQRDAARAEVERLGKENERLNRALRGCGVAADQEQAADDHAYTSTYCLHGQHADCRLTCKICKAPCRCNCHEGEDQP